MEQWRVLLKDHHRAYITWDQYLKNRERVKRNQNRPDSPGVPRSGAAFLPGLLVCGNCGRHMQPSYHASGKAQYACDRQYVEGTYDEAKVRALAAQKSQVEVELTVAHTRVHNQMYQLLTPDQQSKLKEMEANHEARMQKHMQEAPPTAPEQ